MISVLTKMAHLHIPMLATETKVFYEKEVEISDNTLIPLISLEIKLSSLPFVNDSILNLEEILQSKDGESRKENYGVEKEARTVEHHYDLYTNKKKIVKNPYKNEGFFQTAYDRFKIFGEYKYNFFNYFFKDYLDVCPSHITIYTCAFPITALQTTIAKISENIPWCVIEVVPTEELSEADKKEVESYGDFVYVLPPVPIKDYDPEIFERYYKDYVRFLKSMTAEQEEEYLKLIEGNRCPECGNPVDTQKDKACKNCGRPI